MADHTITKAITIHGWWARAILDCGKRVENRSRPLPRHMIGVPVALHVGREMGDMLWCAREWARVRLMHRPENEGKTLDQVPVDAVTLGECVKKLEELGPAGPGIVGFVVFGGMGRTLGWDPWGMVDWPCWWMIDWVERFNDPIPCKGFLGFWTLPEDVAEKVNRAKGGGRG